ncbi:MAG: hypothetical protein M2R46_01031 [Verrucomicrobia subdivision 3 bacterium]|nr:hypothetical protein [Limisphaerales bacterium]
MAWFVRQAVADFLERYCNDETQLPLPLAAARSERRGRRVSPELSMPRSDLPFGSEFSPAQIDLPVLLKLAHKHGSDWKSFEATVRNR